MHITLPEHRTLSVPIEGRMRHVLLTSQSSYFFFSLEEAVQLFFFSLEEAVQLFFFYAHAWRAARANHAAALRRSRATPFFF